MIMRPSHTAGFESIIAAADWQFSAFSRATDSPQAVSVGTMTAAFAKRL